MDGVRLIFNIIKSPRRASKLQRAGRPRLSSLFAVVPLPAGRKGAMNGGQAQVGGHYGKVLENDYGDGI
jgi:hypothetical protein